MLSTAFAQKDAEAQLRKVCIYAAMYLGCRGLESARVSGRIQSILEVWSTKEGRSPYRECKDLGPALLSVPSWYARIAHSSRRGPHPLRPRPTWPPLRAATSPTFVRGLRRPKRWRSAAPARSCEPMLCDVHRPRRRGSPPHAHHKETWHPPARRRAVCKSAPRRDALLPPGVH